MYVGTIMIFWRGNMVHCLCECHYSLDCNDAKDEIIMLKYTKYIINKCVHTKSIS